MPRRSTRRRCPATVAVAVGFALSLHAVAARADETPAERLFREGRASMLDGRLDEACPALAESQRLEPHVGTLLNLAACHERAGKVGSAWIEYQKALTAARAEGQAARVRLAEERIAALEPRVPWLRITGADGSTVTLDGGELSRPSLGTELPVDPGLHLVATEQSGARVFEQRVELREGEHRTVDVPSGPLAGGVRPSTDRLVVETRPADPDPGAAPQRRKGRWILEPGLFVGYVGGSVSRPRLTNSSESDVRLVASDTRAISSCANQTCRVGEIVEGGGLTGGLNLFGGYALSDSIDVGAKLLVGPSIGPAGASVAAFGPALTVHPTEALTLGVWGLFGVVTMPGHARVTAPEGFAISGSSLLPARGETGGIGAGVELSLRLFEVGKGAVKLSATPFVISGSSGDAFCLPLGLAYRFQ